MHQYYFCLLDKNGSVLYEHIFDAPDVNKLFKMITKKWKKERQFRLHCQNSDDLELRRIKFSNIPKAVSYSDTFLKQSAKFHLTKKEKEIMYHAHSGLSYKMVADKLHLSPFTVQNHIRHIFEKLKVHCISAANHCLF